MIIPFSSPQVTRVHYFTRLLAFLKAKVVKALADFATELKVAKTIHMCFVGIRAELGIHLVGEVDLEVVGVPVCAQLGFRDHVSFIVTGKLGLIFFQMSVQLLIEHK
jgi:hypothetical protein